MLESKRNNINEERKLFTMHYTLSLRERERERVCVSAMNRQWPGNINALSDCLHLSRNVTGAPEQDLIEIWELLVCN